MEKSGPAWASGNQRYRKQDEADRSGDDRLDSCAAARRAAKTRDSDTLAKLEPPTAPYVALTIPLREYKRVYPTATRFNYPSYAELSQIPKQRSLLHGIAQGDDHNEKIVVENKNYAHDGP